MSDEAVAIRAGAPEDAAACAAILNHWIDARDWMPRVHSHAEVAAFYRDFVFRTRSIWVAGDPVAGFLALDSADDRVTALYVATPGRGIGRALLDRAKTGRRSIEVWTFVANEAARAFYCREGFREIRSTDGDNEEGLPNMLLRLNRG